MDSNRTAQRSATMPLLPVSYNPSISNPHISLSITSRFTAKLVLLHRIFLFVLGIVTLLCVAMATSLVPQPPKIKLNSLLVSNIKVSNTTLGANFDVAFKIENPNLFSWIRFEHIDGSISYKDNALMTYSLDPFVLGLKEHRMMRMKISVNGLQEDQPVVKERVLEEIHRQHEDGAVNFSLEMFARATYRTGWWGTKSVLMNPQCLDLRVGFLPKVGFGSWISGGPMTCAVPMLIDD